MCIQRRVVYYCDKRFSRRVNETHPVVKPCDDEHSACGGIPKHTIVIESLIETKERGRNEIFHNYVINNFGDTYVKEGMVNKYIDPALKFYWDIPLMITIYNDIKKGKVNGTLRRVISVKLKTTSDITGWWKMSIIYVSIGREKT